MAPQVKYPIGTIVRLKSGGPDMTVLSSPDPGHKNYHCQWFAGKKLEHGYFNEDSIELVTIDKK